MLVLFERDPQPAHFVTSVRVSLPPCARGPDGISHARVAFEALVLVSNGAQAPNLKLEPAHRHPRGVKRYHAR